jgi:hypothetical protein
MDFGAMVQFVAMPIFIMNSTWFLFNTGSTPGIPRQTGHTLEFGALPNFVEQLQKAFDFVKSCA